MTNKVDFSASINLWNECNFQCPFCIGARVSLHKKSWQDDNEKLQKLKKFFSNSGKWGISLIGGEPLINPYLPEFCEELLNEGHVINGITTNASIPLEKLFASHTIAQFKEMVFSYHPTHEENLKLDKIFSENVRYVVENGVPVTIIYVLLPERISKAADLVKRFENMGARVKLTALYGAHNGKNYPTDYNEHEKEFINRINNDIVAKQLLEYGARISTGQVCGAGYDFFEIFLQSGKVVPCSHQQSWEIFNFLRESSNDFKYKKFNEAKACTIKKCVCGFSYKQKMFIAQYGVNNMEHYEEWQEMCSSNHEVEEYWKNIEQTFAYELTKLLKGEMVFVWGAGIHTSKVLELLAKEKFPIHLIRGIIDSNPEKNGKLFNGIPIISADVFLKNKKNECSDIIISSACYENEIYNQIITGIGNADINIIRLYNGTFSFVIPI